MPAKATPKRPRRSAGTSSRVRPAWFAGAVLLGVVVPKLFLLDLAELSALAKIGTFLGVGMLLLLVGAVAPVPPTAATAPETPA